MSNQNRTSMQCVFLLTKGETIEGRKELERLGYDVKTYPTTQDTSCLRDTHSEDLASIFPWKNDLDTPYARSLRSSFIRMILDPLFADDDFIIFGESDSTPVTEAGALRENLERYMKAHPETDVFRLFHHKQTTCPNPPESPESFLFSPLPISNRSKLNVEVWGTHALVIPVAKRQKVAEIFLTYRLPTDNAIEAACYRHELIMRKAEHNHFYQKPRTTHCDKNVSYANFQRNMALCLSTCGEVNNLVRQIDFFMEQPYQKFHLFASVSGIPESVLIRSVLPHCNKWIESGRLTLRHAPLKNRLSDLINTVRGQDISPFDLFVKIVPDILYSHDFLNMLNDFHSGIPQYYSGYLKTGILTSEILGAVRICYPTSSEKSHETTFSLTPELMHDLMRYENNPDSFNDRHKGKAESWQDYAMEVDDLLFYLIKCSGKKDMSDHFHAKNRRNRGVCQNKATHVHPKSEKSIRCTMMVLAANPYSEKHMLELKHPNWTDTFITDGNIGTRLSCEEAAKIIEQTDNRIIVKWYRYGFECFKKNEEGVFINSTVPTLMERAGKTVRERDKTSRPSWGVCAVAIPRESYYWLQDWIEHHLQAGASMVTIYDNTGSRGSHGRCSSFLGGALQTAKISKRGEQYGTLTSHLSDEDIDNHLHSIIDKLGRDKVRVVKWQPRDAETGIIIHNQVEAYEDYIMNYGDEIDWCAFIDLDEYLYCRPGLSIGSILQQTETDMPDVAELRMNTWRFQIRWGKNGPNDIRQYVKHLKVSGGGEKNILYLKDIIKGDVHWYWELVKGKRCVTVNMEDLAFCHYNAMPEKIQKGSDFISPRQFLKTPEDPSMKFRLK